jgi:hypothetical protein
VRLSLSHHGGPEGDRGDDDEAKARPSRPNLLVDVHPVFKRPDAVWNLLSDRVDINP